MALRLHRDLLLYLDFFPGQSMVGYVPCLPQTSRLRSYTQRNHLKTTGTVMVFLKKFDTSRQTFNGVGRIHVQKASKVRDLVPIINKRMRWSLGTPLRLYEVTTGVSFRAHRAYTLPFLRKLNLG